MGNQENVIIARPTNVKEAREEMISPKKDDGADILGERQMLFSVIKITLKAYVTSYSCFVSNATKVYPWYNMNTLNNSFVSFRLSFMKNLTSMDIPKNLANT